jgi:SAM-dependent methyltransferase
MKLNLGCGDDIRNGYLNIDKYIKADKQIELNKVPYPFKTNSVDEILALNILEHLNNPYDILMEWHRICKHGAVIKILVPHFSSGNAWGDIQHTRPYSVGAFFNKDICNYFEVVKWKVYLNYINSIFRPLINYNLLCCKIWEYFFSGVIRSGDLYIELKVIKKTKEVKYA